MAECLTTIDAATILRVSDRRVRALAARGSFGQKCGGRWSIARADLERFRSFDRRPGRPCPGGPAKHALPPRRPPRHRRARQLRLHFPA